MEKKNLLLLAILTATAINAIGQSVSLGLPGSSYIDNIADSSEAAVEDRFWTTRSVSATYSFLHVDGFSEQDTHAFVPELYLQSATGLSLNIGGVYAHSSSSRAISFFGSKTTWDAYGISIQPAYDTLALWNQQNRPEFLEHSKLIAGLGLAYIHRDVQEHYNYNFAPVPFNHRSVEFQTDGFLLNPNLVFVQPVGEKFITFLIPAYSMEWSRAEYEGGTRSDSDYGYFTLTARGDYKVAERLSVSAFATWIREITSRPAGINDDWAEFGGQLRFAIGERMSLRAGYSYEAFHPYFEAHHCFGRFEANF
jgi:hypothetical protein